MFPGNWANVSRGRKRGNMSTSIKRLSWYALSTLGAVLALPTLLSCLTVIGLLCYELIIRDIRGTLFRTILHAFSQRTFAISLLYIFLGPVLACLLCIGQLTRAEQTNNTPESARRLAKIVLVLSLASIALFLLVAMIGGILRDGT